MCGDVLNLGVFNCIVVSKPSQIIQSSIFYYLIYLCERFGADKEIGKSFPTWLHPIVIISWVSYR